MLTLRLHSSCDISLCCLIELSFWSNVLVSWMNNKEMGCSYWDQNTFCPIILLQLSQGALPLVSDQRTKLFNWQVMEWPRVPPLLLRIRWEREVLSWSWEWRDPDSWILKEGMHENREEMEIGGGTFMGYSPFKDLSLNQPWKYDVEELILLETGPVSDFKTL